MALGDSITFGQGVNDDETFLHLFDSKRPEYEVINAAVPTWGLSQYSKYLMKVAPDFNPDEVILFFYLNDFMGADYYYSTPPLPKLKLPETPWGINELGLRRISYVYNHYKRFEQKNKLNEAALSGHNSYLRLIKFTSQFNIGKQAFSDIGEKCKENEWRCTLVTLPLLEDSATNEVRFVLDKATAYALDAGIKVIRMDRSLDSMHVYDRWLFPCDQHLSPLAHRKVADVLDQSYMELYPPLY